MTSVVHRPALLPDVFGWLEHNWPFGVSTVRVEEYVDGDRYVVRAELPGVDPDEDLKVVVADGRLLMRVRRVRAEHESGHSEFHYGTFNRILPVPAGVTADDVSAAYRDGILEITMPANGSRDSQPVKVEIGRGK